jgi:hypothetical protein
MSGGQPSVCYGERAWALELPASYVSIRAHRTNGAQLRALTSWRAHRTLD